MKEKNIRIIVIILFSIAGLLTIGGILTAFLLNYNQYKPAQVQILDDGQNIYVSTELNDNYSLYRFVFKDNDGNEIIIDSEKNTLSVEELINQGIKIGTSYEITTCYLSENSGNNSLYSDSIPWTCYTYLASPTLQYDENNNLLKWESIDNADYYQVFFNHNESENFVKVETNSICLTEFDSGNRTFYVIAYSNDNSYRPSIKSNELNLDVVRQFKEFNSVRLEGNDLIITGEELLEKILIYINDETAKEVVDFQIEYDEEENLYTFTIDIKTILPQPSGFDIIGASPAAIDEYNVFTGDIVYVRIETQEI